MTHVLLKIKKGNVYNRDRDLTLKSLSNLPLFPTYFLDCNELLRVERDSFIRVHD